MTDIKQPSTQRAAADLHKASAEKTRDASTDGASAGVAQEGHAVSNGSGAMFDAIASKYDRLNRVLSFGLDRWWRAKALQSLALAPGARVLDLATGTADLAIATAKGAPKARVIGLDPSAQMLAIGRQKIQRMGLGEAVALVEGDAQRLPFLEHSFDAITMAFGIRNVPDRERALREMMRVLRPGGRLAILELGPPGDGALGALATWYVRHVLPRIGGLLSSRKEYAYLQRSMEAFPRRDAFVAQLGAAGWTDVSGRALGVGGCFLFVATKPLHDGQHPNEAPVPSEGKMQSAPIASSDARASSDAHASSDARALSDHTRRGLFDAEA